MMGASSRIAASIKDIENRTRSTKYRGPLIHESQSHAYLDASHLREIEEYDCQIPEIAMRSGGIIDIVDLVACVEFHDSPWFEGACGFVLRNARQLPFAAVGGLLDL